MAGNRKIQNRKRTQLFCQRSAMVILFDNRLYNTNRVIKIFYEPVSKHTESVYVTGEPVIK